MNQYKGILNNVRICGIASAVPKRTISNKEIVEQIGNKKLKRQILLTGIEERHICDKGQSASDLATIAAKSLLDEINWSPTDINLLVFVTQQPDLARPSTAMLIQKRLGIPNGCSCFDVNMGCSGFTVGLQIVASMLQPVGGRALMLVGDGRYTEDDSARTDLLFADGGAAVAVELVDDWPMIFEQFSDGNRFDTIVVKRNGEGHMDGNGVLLFALNEVSDCIKDFKVKFDIDENSIDYYVYHQAQQMILQGICSETGTDWDKFLNSYKMYGNTSSASIPISICANLERIKCKPIQKLMMCGFGIGLSWGIVYMPVETKHIMGIIETDYSFPDKTCF